MKHLNKVPLLFFLLWQVCGKTQNLPSYTISVFDTASRGYYFLTPAVYMGGTATVDPIQLILDSAGQVVYYKDFYTGATSNFTIQPNGLMSYNYKNKFYLMDSAFNVVDSINAGSGLSLDGHDLQILPNGHYLLLCSETLTMDLSQYHYFNHNGSAGSANAQVKCGVIQELDANKNVVFEWHSKNYFAFDDVDESYLASAATVDWTHLNAIELDNDGNLLLSVRHFNEIDKINRSDSSIIWRLGGKHNMFNFTNDSSKFLGQHDIRRISNGHITLLDNGRGGPSIHPATAKEYEINDTAFTATLAWSYTQSPSAYSQATGNVQRLSNGNTLIDYGMLNGQNLTFNVVKPTGIKVFEISFADTLYSYRAFNYLSLPWQLHRPQISCFESGGQYYLDAGTGYSAYQWSTGSTNETIPVTATGDFYVFLPLGDGGFIRSANVSVTNINNPCGVNGVRQIPEGKGISIFPNPVSNMAHISFSQVSSLPQMIEVFDYTGNKLSEYAIDANRSGIDLYTGNLPAGVYFVKYGNAVARFTKF